VTGEWFAIGERDVEHAGRPLLDGEGAAFLQAANYTVVVGILALVVFRRFEGLSGCHRSGRSMVMPPQQR
jgi:hypothetical protein